MKHCLVRVLHYLADQIDIGHGWLGDLFTALIFSALAVYGVPLLITAGVAMYGERQTMTFAELVMVCIFMPMLFLAAIGLPLALFRLAVRKWKNR